MFKLSSKYFVLTLLALWASSVFAQKAETPVRLLAWNIFMIPKPVNFTKQLTRANIIGEQLQDAPYDVIFLQEAFIKGVRKRIAKAMQANFPHQHYMRTDGRFPHIMGSGVFILSRLPFTILEEHTYRRCKGSDCLAGKGLLLVEIEHQGKKLQLGSTHLQAWEDDRARQVRSEQLADVKAVLQRHALPGVPQVLAGDLNVDGHTGTEYPLALEFMEMEAPLLSGELQSSNGFPIPCFKKPGGDNPQWLDHVWIKNNDSTAQVLRTELQSFSGILKKQQCPLSDHHGISAIISL